jgi:hypothetical protein
MGLVVAENRINRNFEGIFEEREKLCNRFGVIRNTSFPNSVTDYITSVVDIVEILSKLGLDSIC